jgi:hypothetical protein
MNPNSIVTLNVGGTVFHTLRDTLLNESNTYFSCMLDTRFAQPNDLVYFIERSRVFQNGPQLPEM